MRSSVAFLFAILAFSTTTFASPTPMDSNGNHGNSRFYGGPESPPAYPTYDFMNLGFNSHLSQAPYSIPPPHPSYSLASSPSSYSVPASPDIFGMGNEASSANYHGNAHPLDSYWNNHQYVHRQQANTNQEAFTDQMTRMHLGHDSEVNYPSWDAESIYSNHYQSTPHDLAESSSSQSHTNDPQSGLPPPRRTRRTPNGRRANPPLDYSSGVVRNFNKCKEYQWQQNLSDEVVMKIYVTIASHWAPGVELTNRANLDRLNAYLEHEPHLANSILAGDQQVIEWLAHISGPQQANPSEMTVGKAEPLDKLLRWIRTPIKDWSAGPAVQPRWAPDSMDYYAQQDFIKALHIAWKMARAGVKKMLTGLGPDVVEEWYRPVLSQNAKDAAEAAHEFRELVEQTKPKRGRKVNSR